MFIHLFCKSKKTATIFIVGLNLKAIFEKKSVSRQFQKHLKLLTAVVE
jgi:hypothetical protein